MHLHGFLSVWNATNLAASIAILPKFCCWQPITPLNAVHSAKAIRLRLQIGMSFLPCFHIFGSALFALADVYRRACETVVSVVLHIAGIALLWIAQAASRVSDLGRISDILRIVAGRSSHSSRSERSDLKAHEESRRHVPRKFRAPWPSLAYFLSRRISLRLPFCQSYLSSQICVDIA